ncbi:FAD-binding oxidoreductase, partial [Nocardioides sp.]|uniref:NAD(P)/FAD-dependent oxidoreductase n=1 Tax=Nocardioides sp. TaxID=35761 RepID=UPI0027351DD6
MSRGAGAADDMIARQALADATPRVFWLDDPARPEPAPPLAGDVTADLVVVGGGYTGLWTALLARRRWPEQTVVLVEAGRCGDQASGRNGGFASASLTHGFGNGLDRWPDELAELDRLGADNLHEIGETIHDLGIDCDWRLAGELTVATAPHEVAQLRELATTLTAHGHSAEWLDRDGVRALVDSPTYLAGLLEPDGTALVEPARLAWGLRRACLDVGVVVHEGTSALGLERDGAGIRLRCGGGTVRAGAVALATNAFPPLLRRLRLMTVPVYDHVLMTEPLSADQLATIGWSGRHGVADAGNKFHYYRLTRDDRILWGGFEAGYHFGSRIHPSLEQSDE